MEQEINEKQNIQIAEIKKDVTFIKEEISDIKNNHLKSIYTKLDNQKGWLIGLLGAVIITMVGVILNLLK